MCICSSALGRASLCRVSSVWHPSSPPANVEQFMAFTCSSTSRSHLPCLCAGALYVFPQLHLPQKAVEAAKKEGKSPDFLYCRSLLQEKVTRPIQAAN